MNNTNNTDLSEFQNQTNSTATLTQLRKEARSLGLTVFAYHHKDDLVELIASCKARKARGAARRARRAATEAKGE